MKIKAVLSGTIFEIGTDAEDVTLSVNDEEGVHLSPEEATLLGSILTHAARTDDR